jgi:hypothetical protein
LSLAGSILSSPAIGDLDGDGYKDILAGSDSGKVYAIKKDGTFLPGWPVQVTGQIISSPIIADINNDGSAEVLVGTSEGKIYAWSKNGVLLSGWPLILNNWVNSTLALGDLDRDGEAELVAGDGDSLVYVWELGNNSYNQNLLYWPLYRGDAERTGLFFVKTGANVYGDANSDGKVTVADVVFLINFLFKGGPRPSDLTLADANADCHVTISDVVYLVAYLFKFGPAPKAGCAL